MSRTLFSRSRRMVVLTVGAGSLLVVAACGSSSTKASPGTASSGAASPAHGQHSDDMPSSEMPSSDMQTGGGEHHADAGKGLLSTEDGYTLMPASTALTVGAQTIRFQILGPDGLPQTKYTEDQTKLLHFYLVRNDLTGYVHDHPTLSADGTWSIGVTTASPGAYRMYADFVAKDAGGKDHPVVLSTALSAPGGAPAAPVTVSPATQTVDGLTVTMAGSISAGTASKVTFRVSQAGRPVADLEQYLDSFAHLTALHAGDLAYQHVHPELTAAPGQKGGPALPFTVELPEKGTWRLFLQVQRGGALHLVPFTVAVG